MQCIHCYSLMREIDGENVCRKCGHIEPIIPPAGDFIVTPEKMKRKPKKTA